jgi:hypothetical protein
MSPTSWEIFVVLENTDVFREETTDCCKTEIVMAESS